MLVKFGMEDRHAVLFSVSSVSCGSERCIRSVSGYWVQILSDAACASVICGPSCAFLLGVFFLWFCVRVCVRKCTLFYSNPEFCRMQRGISFQREKGYWKSVSRKLCFTEGYIWNFAKSSSFIVWYGYFGAGDSHRILLSDSSVKNGAENGVLLVWAWRCVHYDMASAVQFDSCWQL